MLLGILSLYCLKSQWEIKTMEIKFIIVKDKNNGRLTSFKSSWLHHQTIARDNGFDEREIIEAGLILDGDLFILECQNLEHLKHRANRYIGNRLNDYQDLRLTSWLKGRELESQLYYTKQALGTLREGD